jgi:hypothetical protein
LGITYLLSKRPILHPGRGFDLLGTKVFYNNTTQETQWGGELNHTEPQPHALANFSKLAIAWNNLTVGIEWQAPRGCIVSVGNELTQSSPMTGMCVLCAGQYLAFFLLALPQTRQKIKFPYMRKG